MSSRHIRRAKEQLGVSAAKAEAGEEQEEESEEEEEEKIGSAKPFNPFDLLSDGDDDDQVCGCGSGSQRDYRIGAWPCMRMAMMTDAQ